MKYSTGLKRERGQEITRKSPKSNKNVTKTKTGGQGSVAPSSKNTIIQQSPLGKTGGLGSVAPSSKISIIPGYTDQSSSKKANGRTITRNKGKTGGLGSISPGSKKKKFQLYF